MSCHCACATAHLSHCECYRKDVLNRAADEIERLRSRVLELEKTLEPPVVVLSGVTDEQTAAMLASQPMGSIQVVPRTIPEQVLAERERCIAIIKEYDSDGGKDAYWLEKLIRGEE